MLNPNGVGYSYNWSNGAGSGSQAGLTAGEYLVTVTSTLGCFGFDSIVITEPLPLFAGFLDPGDTLFLINGTLDITFSNFSSGGDDYHWDFGDTQTLDETVPGSPTHTYNNEANIMVTLDVSNNSGLCTTSDTALFVVAFSGVGIVEYGGYSNPIIINGVKTPFNVEENTRMEIYDLSGKLLASSTSFNINVRVNSSQVVLMKTTAGDGTIKNYKHYIIK